jgi:DNA (cytosine-5)-methyltransferase 1
MTKVRSHWTCINCLSARASAGTVPADQVNQQRIKPIQCLNLYCGLGGNRKNWQGIQVTAVEKNIKAAAAYKKSYPNDIVIIADAHQYLLENYQAFDIIWSSPPCPSHSKVNTWTRSKKVYPDMGLYQQIIFLKYYFKGIYVIENVQPFYGPLIPATKKLGRHLLWSNTEISDFHIEQPERFIYMNSNKEKLKLMDWLGIHLDKNIYLNDTRKPLQVLKNCVHPDIGASIMNDIIKNISTGRNNLPG